MYTIYTSILALNHRVPEYSKSLVLLFSFSLVHLLLAADLNEGHYQGSVDHSLFLRVGVGRKK